MIISKALNGIITGILDTKKKVEKAKTNFSGLNDCCCLLFWIAMNYFSLHSSSSSYPWRRETGAFSFSSAQKRSERHRLPSTNQKCPKLKWEERKKSMLRKSRRSKRERNWKKKRNSFNLWRNEWRLLSFSSRYLRKSAQIRLFLVE